MTRLFELRSHSSDGERQIIVDLDKVSSVRVEKEPGHHYPRVLVRFADGHESTTGRTPQPPTRWWPASTKAAARR